MSWWSKLDLAWKYSLIFGAALVATLIMGGIRVLYDRRKLAKHIKLMELEKGQNPESDKIKLNTRVLGAADLFGIQAIEAGFYGGVPQSRPASAAPSGFNTPLRSASPLGPGSVFLGGVNQKLAEVRSHGSVTSLSTLAGGKSPSQFDYPDSHLSSPYQQQLRAGGLQPSVAELNGRINHSNGRTGSFGSLTTSAVESAHGGSELLAPGLYDPSRPPSGDRNELHTGMYQDRTDSGSSHLGFQQHGSDSRSHHQWSPSHQNTGRSLT